MNSITELQQKKLDSPPQDNVADILREIKMGSRQKDNEDGLADLDERVKVLEDQPSSSKLLIFKDGIQYDLVPAGDEVIQTTEEFDIPVEFQAFDNVLIRMDFMWASSGGWNNSPANQWHTIELFDGYNWNELMKAYITPPFNPVPDGNFQGHSCVFLENLNERSKIRAKFRFGVQGSSSFSVTNVILSINE